MTILLPALTVAFAAFCVWSIRVRRVCGIVVALFAVALSWNCAGARADDPISFIADKDGVDSIAVSGNAKLLAVGGDTGTVSLWELTNRTQIRATNVGTIPVLAVRFTPDGQKLAVSDGKTGIRILSVPELTQTAELRSQDGVVLALAFSADGSRLASAIATSTEGALDLWSMADRTSRRLVQNSGRAVTDVAFSASGLLAGQIQNGETQFWPDDIEQKPWTINVGKGQPSHVRCLAFSPDGSRLAVAGGRNLRIFDVKTKKWEMARVLDSNEDHVNDDEILDIAFSPDGKSLAMAVAHCIPPPIRPYFSGSVQVWSAEPLRSLRTFEIPAHRMTAVEFLPTGSAVVSASWDGRVYVWSME